MGSAAVLDDGVGVVQPVSASLSQEAGGRVLFAFLLGKAALGFVISVHEVLCMTLIRWLLEWSMQSCSGQNRDAY